MYSKMAPFFFFKNRNYFFKHNFFLSDIKFLTHFIFISFKVDINYRLHLIFHIGITSFIKICSKLSAWLYYIMYNPKKSNFVTVFFKKFTFLSNLLILHKINSIKAKNFYTHFPKNYSIFLVMRFEM